MGNLQRVRIVLIIDSNTKRKFKNILISSIQTHDPEIVEIFTNCQDYNLKFN